MPDKPIKEAPEQEVDETRLVDEITDGLEDDPGVDEPEVEEETERASELKKPKNQAPPKNIPYARFSQLLKKNKALQTEFQKKKTDFDNLPRYKQMEIEVNRLLKNVGKFPFLGKFLSDFVKNDDHNPDLASFNKELTEFLKANPAATRQIIQQQNQSAPDPAIKQLNEQFIRLQEQQMEMHYTNYFQRTMPVALDSLKKDPRFKGVNFDKNFLDDFRMAVGQEINRLDSLGQDISTPNVLQVGRKLAMKYKAIADSVLGRQRKGLDKGQGAGLVDSEGPRGRTKEKAPDAFENPDAFNEFLLKNIEIPGEEAA